MPDKHTAPSCIFILLLACLLISCQDRKKNNISSVWLSYTEEGSDLYGFTDERGNVMIPPQFSGYFSAKKFHNVIGAMTTQNGDTEQFYLLKDGTRFGHDSLYISDLRFDCEHEGYIRFRDPATYNTGLFDSTGRIALVPDYNELSQVHKGYLFATKHAGRVRPQNNSVEPFIWLGGTVALITTDGSIVIDSISGYETLNLHSLSVTDSEPGKQEDKRTFRGNDNKYYSFTDNKLAFHHFLKQLPSDIRRYINDELIIWDAGREWTHVPADTYWSVNEAPIRDFVSYISDTGNTIYINVQNFIPLTDDLYDYFDAYKDDCDNWNSMEYPIFEISYPYDEDKYKSMYFLKMKDGFRITAINFG